MKSLLKFSLLSALIIGGKLVKSSATVTVAHSVKFNAPTDSSIVLVNQVFNAESGQPAREQNPTTQSGGGLLAELF